MCLGADLMRGENQKPFDGKIDYTHIMWIDSDIVFSHAHFQVLLNHDKDIVSGLYMMENGRNEYPVLKACGTLKDFGQQFATVKDWDEEYFKKNGSFKFLTAEDIKEQKDLIEVSYTGFGFMLIKKGVFESMTYPWFKPIEKRIGDMVDYTMEDVAFCLRAKENGFQIFIDPTVRVGHEKKVVF